MTDPAPMAQNARKPSGAALRDQGLMGSDSFSLQNREGNS